MQHSDFIYIYLKNKFADGYFSEKNYTQVSCLLNQFDLQSIVQSIDIAYRNYYLKSLNNNDSLPDHDFIVKKISGILYNNSLPPIEKEKDIL